MSVSARNARQKIVEHFYGNVYEKYLFTSSLQSKGISYFENAVERFWTKTGGLDGSAVSLDSVLELGGGSGEHLPHVRDVPVHRYVSLDLRLPDTKKYVQAINSNFQAVLQFEIGNAEALPFRDASFDRVVATCLLHHVSDPLSVLFEARRVLKGGGEFCVVLPCDPGFLNQIVKRVLSYPRLRKLTSVKPELFYAFEHRNHIGSLLEQIKFAFAPDQLVLHYRPFYLKSWNFNLLVVCHVIKARNS